jgi:putative transposase
LTLTDDSIKKVIFLSARKMTKEWSMPVRDWDMVYNQFAIFFAEKVAI